VAGSKIHLDAGLVDANASLKSVKPLKPEAIRAIEQIALEQVKSSMRRTTKSKTNRRRALEMAGRQPRNRLAAFANQIGRMQTAPTF
jgi:hypothetical protein